MPTCRLALGRAFALAITWPWIEAHLILATIAQRARFELAPGQQVAPKPLITLRPKGGINMIVRRHMSPDRPIQE